MQKYSQNVLYQMGRDTIVSLVTQLQYKLTRLERENRELTETLEQFRDDEG